MGTFYLRIDLPDDEPLPADGDAFYVDNSDYEHFNGLTGIVEADVERKLNGYEQAVRSYVSLHPEEFPPGHELYDADHRYWDGVEEDEITDDMEPYQWDSDTIEWVAMDLSTIVHGDPRIKEV